MKFSVVVLSLLAFLAILMLYKLATETHEKNQLESEKEVGEKTHFLDSVWNQIDADLHHLVACV